MAYLSVPLEGGLFDLGGFPVVYDTTIGTLRQDPALGGTNVYGHRDVFRTASGRLISWQPPNFVDQNTGQIVATTAILSAPSAPAPAPTPTQPGQPSPGTSPGGLPSAVSKILPSVDPATGTLTCPQGYVYLFGQCVRFWDMIAGGFGLAVAVAIIRAMRR